MSKPTISKKTMSHRLVSCPFDTSTKEFDRQIIEAITDLQRAFAIDNVRSGNRIIETANQTRFQEVYVQPGFEIVVERYPFLGGTHKAMVMIRELEPKQRSKHDR